MQETRLLFSSFDNFMSARKEMDFSLENTWRLVEVVKTLDILSCFMMYTSPTVSESEASTLILNMKYAKVGRANKRVCLTHVMLFTVFTILHKAIKTL